MKQHVILPYAEVSDELKAYFDTLGDLAGTEQDTILAMALDHYQWTRGRHLEDAPRTLADNLTRITILENRLFLDTDVQVFYEVACECFRAVIDYLKRILKGFDFTYRLEYEGLYQGDMVVTREPSI